MSIVLIADTREQLALDFGPDVPVVRAGLSVGDYAIDGPAGRPPIAIERKSLADLWGTLASSWPRFERAIGRAEKQGIRLIIVVEAEWREIEVAPIPTTVHPERIHSLIAECAARGVPTMCAGDRARAAKLTWTILRKAYHQLQEMK